MDSFGSSVLTSAMRAAGVRTLHWAVVLMHRPWCMWSTSSHARFRRKRNLEEWAADELAGIELLVVQHEALERRSVPVLVLSYLCADTLAARCGGGAYSQLRAVPLQRPRHGLHS